MRFHPAGQDMKVWAEAISDSSYTEYKSTVESLTAFGSTNGDDPTALTGVTAAFNSDMDMFQVVIPASQLPENGNNFYAKVDWAGIIDLKIEAYITDIQTLAAIKTQVASALSDYDAPTKEELDSAVSPLATSAAITELNNLSSSDVITACGTALGTYDAPTKAEMDSAFSTTYGLIGGISIGESVGTEHVIPPAYYQLDASENRITLLTPYDGVTVEQISLIYDLTLGAELYNCLNPRKHVSFDPDSEMDMDIEIAAGVITFYDSLSSMADGDKIRIIANIAVTPNQ